MKPELVEYKIKIPENVQVSLDKGVIIAKGPKGEYKKNLSHPKIDMKIEGKEIKISMKKPSKNEKKIIGAFNAHLKNVIKGVVEGFLYKLKVCSGHFPMTVSLNKDEFQIKNFFGEKIPRTLKIKPGATVKIDGTMITVESTDKEIAGQVAADIETLTRRNGFDKRIFQDGIYIIEKAGKEI